MKDREFHLPTEKKARRPDLPSNDTHQAAEQPHTRGIADVDVRPQARSFLWRVSSGQALLGPYTGSCREGVPPFLPNEQGIPIERRYPH